MNENDVIKIRDNLMIPGIRLENWVGIGGFGVVFKAIQTELERTVAVKVLMSDKCHEPKAIMTNRFKREAKAAACLDHPNIVKIFFTGTSNDWSYIVMEWLDESLKDKLKRLNHDEHLPQEMSVAVMKQILSALNYAQNEKGLVHRDIKPGNIMFRKDGTVVLVDFGLVKTKDQTKKLTQSGNIFGTPEYMSPEQISGEEPDGRSDIYSLGIVFFEVLTGKVPYQGQCPGLLKMIKNDPIPRIIGEIQKFQPLIDGMLAKDPKNRFQTAADALAKLSQIIENKQIKAAETPTMIIKESADTKLATHSPTKSSLPEFGAQVIDKKIPEVSSDEPVSNNNQRIETRRKWLPLVVGIDIGTTKISTIIGQLFSSDDGKELEIIGFGKSDSEGLRKGVVVDVQTIVENIKKSVKEAELTGGVEIESAFINISGSHVQSINSKGAISLTGSTRMITKEDVDRAVIHGSSSIILPNDKEILHVLPQEFLVDHYDDIKNPIGMIGASLEVHMLIVTASKSAVKNLLVCLKLAKIDVLKVVLSHIASAEAVLTSEEKELGVALIDIGSETSDIAVYEKGALSYASSIGVGGYNFTNDLAIGTRTPIDKAEKIKRKYGCGTDPNLKNQNIEIPILGGKKVRLISASLLSDILKPRIEEIFEIIKDKIETEGLENKINAGVVLTGGSSNLEGLLEIADNIFSVPVRIGRPFGLSGLLNMVKDPEFSTSVGLVKYGYMHLEDRRVSNNHTNGLLQRIKKYIGY